MDCRLADRITVNVGGFKAENLTGQARFRINGREQLGCLADVRLGCVEVHLDAAGGKAHQGADCCRGHRL